MVMRYEKMVNEMTKITSAILDMEGGRWLLAVMYELLENLLAIEDYMGCCLITQKISEIAMSNFLGNITSSELYILLNEILPDVKRQITE